MASLRFIHCADLHLDRPFEGLQEVPAALFERIRESTFRSFKRIIDAAIEHQVDCMVIAGDLYDGERRSLRAQVRFRDEIERLGSRGIQVYVIHGNHDHLGGDWVRLDWPDHVHFFGSEVEALPFEKNGETLAHLYGFSYPERAVVEDMSKHYVKKDGAPFHIGILHGYHGASGEHDRYAPFSISEFVGKDFDYWALGHIHKKQLLHEDPPVLYPGNIQGLSKKESGEKGCFLVKLDDDTTDLSFIPTADVEWKMIELDISEFGTVNELFHECGLQLDTIRREDRAVLAILKFTGAGDLHTFLLDGENIDDLLAVLREGEDGGMNVVWPVFCTVDTLPNWSRQQLKREGHFVGDLLRLIDYDGSTDEALSPLLQHRKAKRYLSGLDEGDRKRIIKDAEELLLTELLNQ
jgi:exonuclease SbcD